MTANSIIDSQPENGDICVTINENSGIVNTDTLFIDGMFIKRERANYGGVAGYKQPNGLWGFVTFPTHWQKISEIRVTKL